MEMSKPFSEIIWPAFDPDELGSSRRCTQGVASTVEHASRPVAQETEMTTVLLTTESPRYDYRFFG